MKFFLGMFLASEAMVLVQSVDNVQRVSTRKLAKHTKGMASCTKEVGELKGTIDSLQKDIDVLQKQCAPDKVAVNNGQRWGGDYIYPGYQGGVYQASLDCDYVGDICSVSEYRIGSVIDINIIGVDSDETDVQLGDAGSHLFLRPSLVLDPSKRCTLSGTFIPSKVDPAASGPSPIPLVASDACSDAGKAMKFVVQIASLFDRPYAAFSKDGGLTYYTEDKPYTLTRVPSGARFFGSLVSGISSAVNHAVHVAVVSTTAVSDLVTSVLQRDPNDPDIPTYPDGTPVNYTNPFNPVASAPGWTGGFAESNPAFAYPIADLSSIEVETNMANIDKLTRMKKVRWPEFSWEMVPGRPSTRIFTTFATYISRLGYDDAGRVWSIICPQQGFNTDLADLNLEVTVTGTRGWTDEPSRSTAAELGVMAQVWFTANTRETAHVVVRMLFGLMAASTDLPLSKSQAIQVLVNDPGNLNQPLLKLENGQDPAYQSPHFKVHWNDGAASNVNVQAQIGEIVVRPGQSQLTTLFNELIIVVFNALAGNLLITGNILSWNIWFGENESVDQEEWLNHADRWRESLNTNLTSPDQDGSSEGGLFYFDGSMADPHSSILFLADTTTRIMTFIYQNFPGSRIDAEVRSMHDDDSFSESDEQEFLDQLHRHRHLKRGY